MNVSIVASAVRPKMWHQLLKSLKNTSVTFEVVFCGHCTEDEVSEFTKNYHYFRYIHTNFIKPSQCYSLAFKNAIGDYVLYTADDAEYVNNVVGKAYDYCISKNNRKLILSIQTKESGYGLSKGQLFDMNVHRFFGGRKSTPLMSPLGLINRSFYEELGGIDRRYISGQWENDLVCRAYANGGTVEIFGDKDCFIDIDHLGKSIAIGESNNERDFLQRPFATGYEHDRKILEGSWVKDGKVTFERNDKFEPFLEQDILTVSQSYKGKWQ